MELFSARNKKTIELYELEKKFKIENYNELYKLVNKLIDEEKMQPIKSSGGNGKKPTLYKKYRLIIKEENYDKFLEEINFKLSTRFNLDYYRKNLKKYKEHREYILKLSQFLKNNSNLLNIKISMNERAFQIFGREKFIQKELGKTIFKNLGIDISILNFYETSEPIAYYSMHKNMPQNILIIENKDTYYTLRRHLLNGNNIILGDNIDTVMYGGGKSVNRAFKDYGISVEKYLLDDDNKMFYFGDLDYEGILIYESFYKLFKDKYWINPFIKGYEKMIDKSEAIGLPLSKKGQNKNIGDLFLNKFNFYYREKIQVILERGEYIPQEILNITDI
ncbi:Wadjet anti-phage system protein JetD domain-containing protein [uncultured Clostridium sp.]|uniref:Wadjet anti-phage system protein JetD domain-containing protein n=1 Tax=uncultured Clostridium sp. TaxID=59620 RepID=UPI0026359E1D|nr:Wadjet anti-phage system protein JetD domain-containing protein [uncultured Clostridium sp.]